VRALVALFASVICDSSFSLAEHCTLLVSVRYVLYLRALRGKRQAKSGTGIYHPRTAGYHLESGFFGAVTEQKRECTKPLGGFRANGGNLRPTSGASESVTALRRTTKRKREERRIRGRSVRERTTGYKGVVYQARSRTYVRNTTPRVVTGHRWG